MTIDLRERILSKPARLASHPCARKKAQGWGTGILFFIKAQWSRQKVVLAFSVWVLAFAPPVQARGASAAPVANRMAKPSAQRGNLPPRVIQAERFLEQRGLTPGSTRGSAQGPALGSKLGPALGSTLGSASHWTIGPAMRRLEAARAGSALRRAAGNTVGAYGSSSSTPATATWQALGPTAVQTANFGLVTGRVTSVTLDPADSTGNRLYIGTTGGGVWEANNADAANASSISFTPLTDSLAAVGGAPGASISIGALTVQPGATNVILAGTGDPNDALDSYYGAGILRSADGGNTWTLIQKTQDLEQGLGAQDFSFVGEGFAGFAWSTVDPQRVVAAVSQAYEGALVNANQSQTSYEGLYYSPDAGATWHLATITDGGGADVQGPLDPFTLPDGNAATSVVWNPVRKLFVAAVRYHGYYQSPDGVTWTRMSAQPGVALTTSLCPTNPDALGSIACPIFRGTLAVNPETGDTFAWTVDIDNQDEGIWQDQCNLNAGACNNPAISFTRQLNTAALEANSLSGAATIPNGDYNLALAAVPSGQDTLVLAGGNDLWETACAPNGVCNSWRNTTNATTCMSAQVGEFQHAIEWNTDNPHEVFVGNDSGLWRSTDAIGESSVTNPEPACSPTDASHFENLNGGLGSLAEPVSVAQSPQTPYTMMAGLGVNGTAGVKSTTGATADWPQILSGEGGPVAIDAANPDNWYVNNAPGVSIHLCSQSLPCTQADFGESPAIDDSDAGDDGLTMTTPAPFLVDPLDPTQLLIGTCRVWRGAANGAGWTSTNAISPVLDSGATGVSCNGDALIRSMAALALPGGTEVVYLGMYGAFDGGANLPGHIWRAVFDPSSSSSPVWEDLTLNPVTNDTHTLNYYGYDISSIFIDPHDTSGNTVYATVEGMNSAAETVQSVYGTSDGGAHWSSLTANLPTAPASSVVVDPLDSNTVYVATDAGVYFTTQVGNCATPALNCWSAFGSGLPAAPAVALSAAPTTSSQQVLVAATYGRGIWETPLWTSSCAGCTEASPSPASLTFPVAEPVGAASLPIKVTLSNTGAQPLAVTGIASSDPQFTETDTCVGKSVAAGSSCVISVTLTPTTESSVTATLAIGGNVFGGQVSVDVNWTPGASSVTLLPSPLDFDTALAGPTEVGTASQALPVTLQNTGTTAITISNVAATGPFAIALDSCFSGSGTSTLAATSSCSMKVTFNPTAVGSAAGVLTVTDTGGTQSIGLSGTGAEPADSLIGSALTGSSPSYTLAAFPGTIAGQVSAAQTLSLNNTGGLPLESIAISVSGPFQVTNNCFMQVGANGSCTISVTFVPTLTGAQTGTLTVSDALRTQTVALSGTGLAPPALSVSPASLIFTGQQPGVASAPQMVTIANSGGAPMANVGFAITGAAASNFSTGATTCGATLNNAPLSGSSCTVQVIFTPSLAGGVAATLTVSSSTLGVTPASVSLGGTVQLATGLSVSPVQLTFAAVGAGQSTPTQSVTVSNTTKYAFSAVTVSTAPPFVVTQNTCTGALGGGASCTVAVEFQPTSDVAATGTLTLSSPALATASSVALIGSGGLEVTPASIAFPTTGAGTTSSPVTLTVANLGAAYALTGLTLTAPSGFQLTANTCAATLPAQSSCTVEVEFTPGAAGQQTGSLTVASSTLGSTPVALSGTGFDFAAVDSGSSSQTVAGGQTADYTLAVTPMDGVQGTFTFQCPTLPEHAVCVFSPSTETLAAEGIVTVGISTGEATAANRANQPPWGALPLVCSVLLLPLAFKRRKTLLMVALLAVLVCFGVSSCTSSGGGSGGGSSGQGAGAGATPAGTYSVPVTVSSTGVSHTVTLTVTVD
ncbi:MAG: choice-of-anchor D domain-containing protein [Terracidiphilus sp.]